MWLFHEKFPMHEERKENGKTKLKNLKNDLKIKNFIKLVSICHLKCM